MLARLYARFENLGGGYRGLEPDLRSRIKLIYLFLIGSLGLSIICGLFFMLMGDLAVTLLCLMAALITSGELLLIRYQHYRLVKHLFAAVFPVYMVLTVTLTGTFALIAMLTLPCITLTMFIFRQPKFRLVYVFVYFAALSLSYVLYQMVDPIYPVQDTHLINTIGIFLALSLQVACLNLYIGEMRRNQVALARTQKQYHTLFEKAPFPLILYADGGIQDCNRAGLEILGADNKAQVLGRMPSEFSPEAQPDGRVSKVAAAELDDIIRTNGSWTFEWTHRDIKGREFPVEITMASIQADMMFGMWVDLSVRKKDEQRILDLLDSLRAQKLKLEMTLEELGRQRSFYEEILNGLPADIAVFDTEHRYLFLNPTAVKNQNTRRWLIGRTDFDYAERNGLSESMARKRHELFRRVLHSGHSMYWEDRYEKEGKTEVLLRRLSPVFVDGKVKFVVGYGTDISRIKEAESIIKNHNLVLQAEVEERTRALQLSNRELQRSNNDLESFASAASHDLQEPLRAIGSFLQLLRRTHTDRLDQNGQDYIDFALSGVGRLRSMIQALLSYSRLGQEKFDCRPSNLNEIVSERIADLSALISERHAVVELRTLPTELPCEPVMLGMVFYNLIANAIKFNRRDQVRVDIWVEEQEHVFRFYIRDNGIGIAPDQCEKIFEPFKRLHSQEEFAGTGVGLASCRKIVERHGGSIGLNSTPGQGSTFYFTIPKVLSCEYLESSHISRVTGQSARNQEGETRELEPVLTQRSSLPPQKSDACVPSSSQSFPLLKPRLRD